MRITFLVLQTFSMMSDWLVQYEICSDPCSDLFTGRKGNVRNTAAADELWLRDSTSRQNRPLKRQRCCKGRGLLESGQGC